MWTPGCEYARCHCAAPARSGNYLGNNKFVLVIVAADQLVFSFADNQLLGNGVTRRS
jgi:hypothetical protein